jgi:hypothetical protein
MAEWQEWDELSDEEELPSSPTPKPYKRGNRKMRPMKVLIAAVTPHDKETQPSLSFGSMLKKNQLERLEIKKEITQSDIISTTRRIGNIADDIKEAHAKLEILKTKLAHLSNSDEIEACNCAIAEKENLITNLNAQLSISHSNLDWLNNNLEKTNKQIQELSDELSDDLSKEKLKNVSVKKRMEEMKMTPDTNTNITKPDTKRRPDYISMLHETRYVGDPYLPFGGSRRRKGSNKNKYRKTKSRKTYNKSRRALK